MYDARIEGKIMKGKVDINNEESEGGSKQQLSPDVGKNLMSFQKLSLN